MNIRYSQVSIVGLLLATLTTAGCASKGTNAEALDSAGALPSTWSAVCNIGIVQDKDTRLWMATYEQPTLSEQTDADLYGGSIANDSCSDAVILRWQEARQQAGEADAICRVIWRREPTGEIRDVGCAVPVVVVSR